MSKNLVVVLGATGTQGGSVVNALLKHGGYAIRGVTRNPDALAAISLAEKGVDVVSGDLADKDSLIKVFDGAYAVFGVTVAYTPISEELQGQNIVDAAKAASVPLLVWSSLPSATDTSNGKYTTIYHFDQKNAVDKYIATAGQPTVILHTGGFAENLLNFHMLQPDSTDPSKWNAFYPISRSETKMAGVWIDGDLGNIVVAVIDHWKNESWRGKLTAEPIAAAPYELSVEEIVAILTKGKH
ncbi:NAD(P)-binding protein [Calocera cornea HHB12733]|uniref:NAD(P)-binding protein n=1 Tax=Calocera cornea HHB12733 TaxID=1353952 RepID=A0A165HZM8_9BASI|nr:NAD(P)-binding protein [Calocera cornea HHB12733]